MKTDENILGCFVSGKPINPCFKGVNQFCNLTTTFETKTLRKTCNCAGNLICKTKKESEAKKCI